MPLRFMRRKRELQCVAEVAAEFKELRESRDCLRRAAREHARAREGTASKTVC